MSDLSVILVPTDLSGRTREALATACALARGSTRLIVIHVLEGHREPSGDELRALKERLAEFQVSDPMIQVEFVIRAGHAAEEILEIAEESRCGLIVIATHARVGLDRMMLGSVTEEVLRRAHCPVLCLKSSDPGTAPPPVTQIGAFLEID
jgi:nucleotide-binding universal stress UspA family protein